MSLGFSIVSRDACSWLTVIRTVSWSKGSSGYRSLTYSRASVTLAFSVIGISIPSVLVKTRCMPKNLIETSIFKAIPVTFVVDVASRLTSDAEFVK
mgnify:CR=1 FL=1